MDGGDLCSHAIHQVGWPPERLRIHRHVDEHRVELVASHATSIALPSSAKTSPANAIENAVAGLLTAVRSARFAPAGRRQNRMRLTAPAVSDDPAHPYRESGEVEPRAAWTCPPHVETLGARRCSKCGAELYDERGQRIALR